MTLHQWICTLAITTILCACSDHQVAGGVDANTNFLQGTLVLPSKKFPVDSLPVYLEASQSYGLSKVASSWNRIDSTHTDSSGKYSFRIHSDGSYRVSAFVGDSLVYQTQVEFDARMGANLGEGTLSVRDTVGILIDDFESPDTINALVQWFSDASGWQFGDLDTSRISLFPFGVNSDMALGIEDCGLQGYCFHLQTSEKIADAVYDYIAVKNILRSYGNACVKTNYVDSLQINAKGTGTLTLGYWLLDSLLDWNNAEFKTQEFALSEEWTRYTTAISPNQNICLHKLEFGLIGTGELWADDVTLLGSTILELIK